MNTRRTRAARHQAVWTALAGLLVLGLAGAAAAGPTAELRAARGPYYAGVPIEIEVTASGFDADPQPEIDYDAVSGGRIELRGVSPSSTSFMQIINGRITRHSETRVVYSLAFIPDRPGTYQVGPFRITQGSRRAATRPLVVTAGMIPIADSQRIRLTMPEGPYVVGQHVPVTVEWWSAAGTVDRLYNQRARIPLFEREDVFDFSVPATKTSHAVIVIGDTEYPADVSRQSDGGKQWIVRSFTETMIPMQPGAYDIEPPELFVDEVTSFRRDFFGNRIPMKVRKLRAIGQPRTIVVSELPRQGRPQSFAGAVGRGFTLQVSADRSIVQVGDPITLTFTLRGDGTVESAALPPLAGQGALPPEHFRVPEGEIPGVFSEGAKTFEVTIRVLDESVREIPPIPFSWYDPETRQYETTHSRPIALSVRPAQVVSAADVVTAKPAAGGAEAAAAREQPPAIGKTSESDAAETQVAKRFTLTGADLSIETDREKLTRPKRRWAADPRLPIVAYALSALLLAVALAVRRWSQVDPSERHRRRRLKQAQKAVIGARSAAELAASLRALRALSPGRDGGRMDALLARLDEVTFAPGGSTAPVEPELRRRAEELARTLVEEEAR